MQSQKQDCKKNCVKKNSNWLSSQQLSKNVMKIHLTLSAKTKINTKTSPTFLLIHYTHLPIKQLSNTNTMTQLVWY